MRNMEDYNYCHLNSYLLYLRILAMVHLQIYIDDHFIAEGRAHNSPLSKQIASATALKKLKQLCPTLLKKSKRPGSSYHFGTFVVHVARVNRVLMLL